MKRNMDLVRQILLKIHEHEFGYAPHDFSIEGYTAEEIGYHCLILGEAGLIVAQENSNLKSTSPSARPVYLTWQGHEFIENALDEKIWAQAKDAVDKVGDVSFSIWTNVLTQIVSRSLGIGS